jgi:hypothetical protein
MPWYDTEHEYRPEYYGKPIYLQLPISPDWEVYIGGWRYYQDHLLANGGGYLAAPVPPFTWDIDEMRKSAVFDAKKIEAAQTDAPLSLDSAQWNDVASNKLGALSLGDAPPRQPGEVKVAYDPTALYLRFEGAVPEEWTAPEALDRDDASIVDSESFTFLAAPDNNPARYFRFSAGPSDSSMYDARQGFIEDSINPLFNQDDTSWNPEWKLKCAAAKDGSGWQALMVIPFSSLGVEAPAPGTEWKVNFSRLQPSPSGRGAAVSLWSSNPDTRTINNREAFGTLTFK